jgi:hypothetical protein
MTTKFQPLTSGNPNGRPIGTKSRKTIAAEARSLLIEVMRNQALTLGLRVTAAGAIVAADGKQESSHD